MLVVTTLPYGTRESHSRVPPSHLPRVSAEPFGVDKCRPYPLELQLDFIAADEIAEQIVFKGGPIRGPDTVLRVEVLRQELWIQPA